MFGWTYVDQGGEEMGTSPRFPDAESAESWIGMSWPDLHENGVAEVVLFDHLRGRKVYRMGLGAEQASSRRAPVPPPGPSRRA